MAAKLKDLKVTKVDFVDRGANPEANIMITKRDLSEQNEPNEPTAQSGSEDSESLFKSFMSKFVSLFKEQSEPTQKCENIEIGGNNDMKFDVEKMNTDEKAVLKSLQEKYGIADEPKTETKAEPTAKSETGKAVTKAETNDAAKVEKAENAENTQNAEIAELKKRLEYFENKELESVAKKYEVLGKKPEEFAVELKKYKAAGVYDEVIASLDAAVDCINKSAMFTEIGKKGSAGTGGSTSKVENLAREIMKNDPKMNRYQAIDKVYQDNPDLIGEEE